tara:strand:+ start:357 stop:500 length:144 start_codon:yes stop_codon:yes gene_type:complete
MQFKIIQNIKNFIINRIEKAKQNNSNKKTLHYKRNRYGFFSPENKEK